MEEKKSKFRISNYTIIGLTIIVLVGILAYNVYFRIKEESSKKARYVLESKVEYYAKRCYLEDKCGESFTIQDLYNYKYITKELVDYSTDEVVDPKTTISVKDNKVTINWSK